MVYNWYLLRINGNCGGMEVAARKPKVRAILIFYGFKIVIIMPTSQGD